MKVGLFFGSFNPIHNGHLITAQHVLNFYTNEVWFVVTPQNPFKKSTNLLDIKDRLLLASNAINDNDKFKVSDIELNLPIPSYTIDTLQYLNKLHPDKEFFLIIGSDNFVNIMEWKSGEILMSKYNIIIYERPGFLTTPQKFNSNIFLAKAPQISISSTKIRALIQAQKSVRYLIPKSVESLIKEHNYYC